MLGTGGRGQGPVRYCLILLAKTEWMCVCVSVCVSGYGYMYIDDFVCVYGRISTCKGVINKVITKENK